MLEGMGTKDQNNRRQSSSNNSPISSPQANTVHSSFDSMFHSCQESATLFNEFMHRNQNCFEQKRRAEFIHGQNLAKKNMISPIISLQRQNMTGKIRLTMEVQSADFPSLHNGREAWTQNDSLSAIMHDTDCMIQFANQQDENTEAMGIFNQVTITGEMPNIDTALGRLRAFCPITLVVPLINMKDEFATKDLSSLISCWSKGVELCDFPRVQFSILCPPNPFAKGQNQVNSQALVIRASRKDFKMMLAASDAATKLLFKDRERPTFHAYLKIPASQRRMMAGSPEGVLIKAISEQTHAVIHFPSSDKTKNGNGTSYFISGSANSVIGAIRTIQDISPVRIEFEVENEQLVQGLAHQSIEHHRELDQFDMELGIIIQLRKSPLEGEFRLESEGMRHLLVLMTSEENVHSLYKVRQKLLMESCWKEERSPTPKVAGNKHGPRYLEFLKVLVMESAMSAYIGERKVISVCRCDNNNQHSQNHQPQSQQSNHNGQRQQHFAANAAGFKKSAGPLNEVSNTAKMQRKE